MVPPGRAIDAQRDSYLPNTIFKVERFGWTFAPGDKVMQIENDYDKEVYNGDIGFVADVEPEEGELSVSFDGRSITYGFGELDTLGSSAT